MFLLILSLIQFTIAEDRFYEPNYMKLTGPVLAVENPAACYPNRSKDCHMAGFPTKDALVEAVVDNALYPPGAPPEFRKIKFTYKNPNWRERGLPPITQGVGWIPVNMARVNPNFVPPPDLSPTLTPKLIQYGDISFCGGQACLPLKMKKGRVLGQREGGEKIFRVEYDFIPANCEFHTRSDCQKTRQEGYISESDFDKFQRGNEPTFDSNEPSAEELAQRREEIKRRIREEAKIGEIEKKVEPEKKDCPPKEVIPEKTKGLARDVVEVIKTDSVRNAPPPLPPNEEADWVAEQLVGESCIKTYDPKEGDREYEHVVVAHWKKKKWPASSRLDRQTMQSIHGLAVTLYREANSCEVLGKPHFSYLARLFASRSLAVETTNIGNKRFGRQGTSLPPIEKVISRKAASSVWSFKGQHCEETPSNSLKQLWKRAIRTAHAVVTNRNKFFRDHPLTDGNGNRTEHVFSFDHGDGQPKLTDVSDKVTHIAGIPIENNKFGGWCKKQIYTYRDGDESKFISFLEIWSKHLAVNP